MDLLKFGLWPKEAPRVTHSEAEKRVYTALQSGLPKGWIAWHSLRLRTDKESKFSEADFVFADPYRPSILILEVKGGQIEEREGQWLQNGRTLYRLPLDQAHSFRKRLIECSRQDSFHLPTIGVAVCFPDTFFSKQPTQYDLHGLVIGGQDLPYLDTILCKVMDRAVPNPWQVDGPWINRLHELWGETWVPKLKLGERIEFDSDQRVQLDKQQLELLDIQLNIEY